MTLSNIFSSYLLVIILGQAEIYSQNKIEMDIKRFFKRYFIWLALLSIPFWNYFQMVFQTIPISDAESVATGTVIMVFAGAFIGRYLAAQSFKKTVNFPYYASFLWVILFLFFFFFLLMMMKKVQYTEAVTGIFLFEVALLVMSVLVGFAIKATTQILVNRSTETEKIILKSQNELQLLQSQLSPHFLFNTLNNLYGLSIVKDDKLPNLLLKLSELLRYSVYQSSDTFVPLNDELDYIKNYIEFEKIRLEDRLFLTVNLEESSKATIAPMLLIVFVENAFKHSKNTTDQQIKIDINLKVWENNILFSIFNTFDSTQAQNNALNKNSGLGLENVKRRLELLYPDKYELSLEEKSNTYKVLLQLKQS
jgi:sensor histidine kinase YesM